MGGQRQGGAQAGPVGLARGGAVGAGLLLAAVDREGRPSLVWRIESHKRRRKVVAAARAAVHDHHM